MLVSTGISAVILPLVNITTVARLGATPLARMETVLYPAVTLLHVGCCLLAKDPAAFPAATISSRLMNATKMTIEAVNVST